MSFYIYLTAYLTAILLITLLFSFLCGRNKLMEAGITENLYQSFLSLFPTIIANIGSTFLILAILRLA